MTDIADVKSTNTIVAIKHPATGEPTGFEIEIRPMFSPEVKKVTRRIKDQAIKLGQRGKTFDAEDIDKNTTDILVAAVVGWEFKGDATFEKKKPAFDGATLRRVLAIDWIAAQIDEGLGDTGSFFRT